MRRTANGTCPLRARSTSAEARDELGAGGRLHEGGELGAVGEVERHGLLVEVLDGVVQRLEELRKPLPMNVGCS